MGPGPGHTGLMTPWWQQPHQFGSIGQLNQLWHPRQQQQLTLLPGCCWQDHQTGNIHDKKRQEWQTRVQNPPPPYNHLFSWLLDNYKHFVKKLKEWKQIIDTLPKSCNIHHKEVKVGSMWPVVGPSDTQLTQLHLLISRPSVAVPKTWWPAASCPLPLISLPSLDTQHWHSSQQLLSFNLQQNKLLYPDNCGPRGCSLVAVLWSWCSKLVIIWKCRWRCNN